MKHLLFALKVILATIAITSAAVAAPFVVLAIGSMVGLEAINSYSLVQSFAKYRSVLDKVPNAEDQENK